MVRVHPGAQIGPVYGKPGNAGSNPVRSTTLYLQQALSARYYHGLWCKLVEHGCLKSSSSRFDSEWAGHFLHS